MNVEKMQCSNPKSISFNVSLRKSLRQRKISQRSPNTTKEDAMMKPVGVGFFDCRGTTSDTWWPVRNQRFVPNCFLTHHLSTTFPHADFEATAIGENST
jgi:hypothetical protein